MTKEQKEIIKEFSIRLKETTGCDWVIKATYSKPDVPNFDSPLEIKFREDAVQAICSAYKCDKSFLSVKTGRRSDVIDARTMYTYMVSTRAGSGLVRIAKLVGYKDHTTVIHNRVKHLNFVVIDKDYKDKWNKTLKFMKKARWRNKIKEGRERFSLV